MDSRQAYKQIVDALKYLQHDSPESDELINWLYTPNFRLSNYLNELKKFLKVERPTKLQRQEAGYLLEKILVLTFKGLAGYSEIKNYQSASHQYDLLISGDNAEWDIVCDRLYLKNTKQNEIYRGFLVEAKAIGDSVSSSQFARLWSIMSLELCNTVGLGIFFTLKGAAGFPKRGESRAACVRHARLCQVLFHAKSGKKIVVLDKDDILELDQNGALIKILIRKVKELEELSGLPTGSVSEPVDIDLPDYLKDLI
jgi:hypothetical protein